MKTAVPGVVLVTMALMHGACGEGDDDETGGAGVSEEALYGVLTSVSADTESSSYVNLIDSLDIDELDLEQAREFAGFAPTESSGGKIFVADGESPTVTRFDVDAKGSWTDEGMVSFANHRSTGGAASIFATPTRAMVELDVTGHIMWDPSDMSILGTEPGPEQIPLERDGMRASRGYERQVRDGLLFQGYYWADEGFDRYAPTSQIGIYDVETGKAKGALEAPCPHLHIASRDDDGHLYLSNGSLSGTAPLLYEGDPSNCVVRIKAGEETLDDDFTFHFTDVTEGREGAGFRVGGDNRGFFAAFHHERLEITPESDPKGVNYSANWRVWTIDLETREAAPVEGLDYFAGQWTIDVLDGRTFVMLPAADYGASTIYELLADGSVVKRFETTGWTLHMFKVH